MASTAGALAAAGIAVFGTIDIVRSSEVKPDGSLKLVRIGIVTLVDWASAPPAPGSVALVNEFETWNSTVVSAPGASGP